MGFVKLLIVSAKPLVDLPVQIPRILALRSDFPRNLYLNSNQFLDNLWRLRSPWSALQTTSKDITHSELPSSWTTARCRHAPKSATNSFPMVLREIIRMLQSNLVTGSLTSTVRVEFVESGLSVQYTGEVRSVRARRNSNQREHSTFFMCTPPIPSFLRKIM